MYERRHAPLATRAQFVRRVATNFGLAMLVIGGSLAWGMWGYWYFEHLRWLDAFLNAAMLLGGMGPVNPPTTWAGKVFAGIFALYAGLLFMVCAALVLTPVLHRVLHRFHVEERS